MAARFNHVQQSIKIGHDQHNANNSLGKGEGEKGGPNLSTD